MLKPFKYRDLKEIWVEQETDWSCIANATRMALRYFGYDMEEEEIAEFVRGLGYFVKLESGEYILSLPHSALFFRVLGFDVVYRTTLAKTVEGEDVICDVERVVFYLKDDLKKVEDEYTRGCYKALIELIERCGKVCLHQPYRMIRKDDILNVVRKGGVVIAYVTALEYYGIDEDWGHALVLVPHGDGFYVLDGFEKKGYLDKDFGHVWDKALEKAKNFKWDRLVRIVEVWKNCVRQRERR